MKSYRTAGVLWLVAAVFSAGATIAFRNDSVWYVITLIGSVIAAAVGVLLLSRANSSTVRLSTLVAVAWVVMYLILTVDQIDSVGAWTTDVFLALVGAVAAAIAYRASLATDR